MRSLRSICFLVLAVPVAAVAQPPIAVTRPVAASRQMAFAYAAPPAANGSGAFLVEAAAGSLGSLVGMGIVWANVDCQSNDDLACIFKAIGAGGALGIAGASAGTYLAAGYTRSKRSLPGALLGGLLGTAAGLGVHFILNSSSDRNLGEVETIPIFIITQGVGAAAGSRAFGK